MTWSKLHHGTSDELTMLGLPRGVRLLHIEAVEFAGRTRSNGVIRRSMLVRFTDEPDPTAAAVLLVKAGLWVERLDDGWEIVGYLDKQSSAADIDKAETRNKNFQEIHRRCTKGDHERCIGTRRKCQWSANKRGKSGEAAKPSAAATQDENPDPLDDLIRQLNEDKS